MATDNLLRKQRLHIMGYRNPNTQLPIMEELGLGVAASALSKLVSAPLSNVVTRKQTAALLRPNEKTPSFASIYRDIMREKGISGFWSGYSASLLLNLNPSITFLLYEKLKPHVVEHRGSALDRTDIFLLAALCKAAATTLTYPLNIIRIRSEMHEGTAEVDTVVHDRASSSSSKGATAATAAAVGAAAAAAGGGERGKDYHLRSSRYRRTVRQTSGIVGLLSEIVRKEGISALYVGLGSSLCKGFFSHGTFAIISRIVLVAAKLMPVNTRGYHGDQGTCPPLHPPTLLLRPRGLLRERAWLLPRKGARKDPVGGAQDGPGRGSGQTQGRIRQGQGGTVQGDSEGESRC